MEAAAKSIPFVVPTQIPSRVQITQANLCRVVELRRKIEQLNADLKEAESAIRLGLESGSPVEPGTLRAFLKNMERRSVSWKAVVERELGDEYARRVLAATKPDVSVQLVISA